MKGLCILQGRIPALVNTPVCEIVPVLCSLGRQVIHSLILTPSSPYTPKVIFSCVLSYNSKLAGRFPNPTLLIEWRQHVLR